MLKLKQTTLVTITAISLIGCATPQSNSYTSKTYKVKNENICFLQKKHDKTEMTTKISCSSINNGDFEIYDNPEQPLILIKGFATIDTPTRTDGETTPNMQGSGTFYDTRSKEIGYWQNSKLIRPLKKELLY